MVRPPATALQTGLALDTDLDGLDDADRALLQDAEHLHMDVYSLVL